MGTHREGAPSRILARLRAYPPPTTCAQLAAELAIPPETARGAIHRLLRTGAITDADVPWRNSKPAQAHEKSSPKRTIAEKAAEIVEDSDSDRVAALRLLWDINTQTGSTVSPLTPNDSDGVLWALARQLRAAGADLAQRALHAAFPPEAPIAQETENLAPAAPGGDSMV